MVLDAENRLERVFHDGRNKKRGVWFQGSGIMIPQAENIGKLDILIDRSRLGPYEHASFHEKC
jgi:hypothetical protein